MGLVIRGGQEGHGKQDLTVGDISGRPVKPATALDESIIQGPAPAKDIKIMGFNQNHSIKSLC